MSRISILKAIILILNMCLLHTFISNAFLYNSFCSTILKASNKSANYENVIKPYRLQICFSASLIFFLIYLLLCSAFNGFFIFTRFSKYLMAKMNCFRTIFLSIIPILILFSMIVFFFNLLYYQSIYAPPKKLYHLTPINYKSGYSFIFLFCIKIARQHIISSDKYF